MATNITASEFTRQLLYPYTSRPQAGIALFPEDGDSKQVTITITSTNITIAYTGTVSTVISYVGLSIQDVVTQINAGPQPISAKSLSTAYNLNANDIIIDNTTAHTIPSSFAKEDRLENNGVILRLARYTVKYDDTSSIKVKPPYNEYTALPWYPRIKAGSFFTTFNDRNFHFSIPEYNLQNWSIKFGKPFIDIQGEPVQQLDSKVLQVAKYPILWNNHSYPILYNGDSPIRSIIEDIDVWTGKIYLKNELALNTSISIDYTYYEENYIYKYVNLNGHYSQNPWILDKFVVIYLIPIEGNATHEKRTVFHVYGSSLEEAIQNIKIDNPSIPIAIIGAYQVSQMRAEEQTSILDTRSYGGGLVDAINGRRSPIQGKTILLTDKIENITSNIEDTYEDSKSYFDIGHYDGYPNPGAAAIVINLPESLRSYLNEKDLKNKSTKMLAAGIYPIFDYYEELNINNVFSKDISFTSSFIPENRRIPKNSVLVDWGTEEPTLPTIVDGALETLPEYGAYSTYLKSSPDTIIKYKERTLLSVNSKEVWSSWEDKIIKDTREVSSGKLIKGFLFLGDNFSKKQYKDINIISPYQVFNIDVKKSIESKIKLIDSAITDLTSTNYIDQEYSEDGTKKTTSSYFGINSIYSIWTNLASTYFSSKLTTLVNLAKESTNVSTIYNYYNTTSNIYSTGIGTAYFNKTFNKLSEIAKSALVVKGSSDLLYKDSILAIARVLTKFKELVNSLPSNKPIPNRLSITESNVSFVLLDISSSNHEIGKEDKDILQSSAALMRSFASLYSTDMSGLSAYLATEGLSYTILTEPPSWVYDTYTSLRSSEFVNWFTKPIIYNSVNVASHWYAGHDLYQLAGTIALDLLSIYESITYYNNTNQSGSSSTIYGTDSTALTSYIEGVDFIFNNVVDNYSKNLQNNGILDYEGYKLLHALGLYAKFAANDSNLNIDDALRYKTYILNYVPIIVSSLISEDGDFYESYIADAHRIGNIKNIPSGIIELVELYIEFKEEDYLLDSVLNITDITYHEKEVANSFSKTYSNFITKTSIELVQDTIA
jgi:hypothetical protein